MPAAAGAATLAVVLLRWLVRLAVAGVAVLLLIQLIPYGRDHTNPPVRKEPTWASARTRQLAADACFDCHSNVTTWPWYSNVAPVSWLVYKDVVDGRAELNFSEWDLPQDGAGDASEAVRSGSMPPFQYKLLHPKSRLTTAERDTLAAGLAATVAASPPPGGGG